MVMVTELNKMPCNSMEVQGQTVLGDFTGIPMDSDRAKNEFMPNKDSFVWGWPKNIKSSKMWDKCFTLNLLARIQWNALENFSKIAHEGDAPMANIVSI
ncbi:MAG: hypothetical protein GY699_13990 [Desulfobacteraceae bacterium]|nr:hypothetical protein [Desulfobacteraceae bacterium]